MVFGYQKLKRRPYGRLNIDHLNIASPAFESVVPYEIGMESVFTFKGSVSLYPEFFKGENENDDSEDRSCQ